jgi:hypothetical protein
MDSICRSRRNGALLQETLQRQIRREHRRRVFKSNLDKVTTGGYASQSVERTPQAALLGSPLSSEHY